MINRRRRFKQEIPLEQRLANEAVSLREQAEMLPPGTLRQEVLRKARQCEAGSHLSEWLRAPGLRPPE